MKAQGLPIVLTVHYSKTPTVLWTESLFVQQPVIPKTKAHYSECLFFLKYMLFLEFFFCALNILYYSVFGNTGKDKVRRPLSVDLYFHCNHNKHGERQIVAVYLVLDIKTA